ncbi:patatin-like phospholipase family protein [Kribbella sp. CA-253562]|uniref:patatin-like phospholipase family protein n=1 Tax=Kribbella sp. CA-253562 TaxID=3239942 RepID=UPI003D8EDE71
MTETIHDLVEPVRRLPNDPEEPPTDGVAVCLSGGGYRAMLFHTGVLWRLCETRWLLQVDRISTVSGGSLTAAVLAIAWQSLTEADDPRRRFSELVVEPLRALASRTIDRSSVVSGLLSPFSTVGEQLEAELRKHLLGDAKLADLPRSPVFVFNATNTGSGKLVRFSRAGVADWRVGRVADPGLRLSAAVAASSAFPPFLSPYRLDLSEADWIDDEGNDLTGAEYRDELALTDGGVYDNLGLETAWKRCRTMFVADAGGILEPEPAPAKDWAQHMVRVTQVLDHQVRSLRKRQVLDSFRQGSRTGAYVGIRSDITKFPAAKLLAAPFDDTTELAGIKTRLKELSSRDQERLINWGYAAADAGLRSHIDPGASPPAEYPYSGGVSSTGDQR